MAKETPAVNDLAHQDPRYLEAWQKLQEVRGRIDQIDRLVTLECGRIAEARNPSVTLEAARALVYGHEVATASGPCEDLKKLNAERQVYVAAVEIAEQRVRDVERQVSAEIIERIRPAYLEVAKRLHAAAVATAAAAHEEDRFISRLVDGGTLLGSLQRVMWPGMDAEALDHFVEETRKEALHFHGLEL
jgi:hypothetical protein